jgi:transposase
MALNSKIKVPMPKEGIIIRSSGTYRYVYKVLRAFRNERGQPTNARKQIGRLDPENGMLIPNDNYYEYYGTDKLEMLPSSDSVRSVGATFLVSKVLESLGVRDALDSVFGLRSEEIMTVAAYMTCRGNVMEHILDWCDGFTLHEAPVSSQKASSLFSSISHNERMMFFKAWLSKQKNIRYLAYDVTSFSSYAEGIADAEWGYNRDGDKLPQINLGCYFSEESGLPVFYVTYPGSIVDKSHLPHMMAYNSELGIDGVGFVMDRGFCTTANVVYMHSLRLEYIMGVDMRHKATQDAIGSVRESIVSVRYSLNGGVYAKSVHSRFYGVTAVMHIYYDPDLAERQRRDLYRLVGNMASELEHMEHITKREVKRYSRWFDINRYTSGAFTFKRNDIKVDTDAKNSGFFCLLSNTELDSADILTVYRRKDLIEKGFDDLKNHVDMKRLRTHTNATTEGKLFCAFIALIVASNLTSTIREIEGINLSKRSVISEFEKIKSVTTQTGTRMMNPLTKKQRAVLEAFGLCEKDIKQYIVNG